MPPGRVRAVGERMLTLPSAGSGRLVRLIASEVTAAKNKAANGGAIDANVGFLASIDMQAAHLSPVALLAVARTSRTGEEMILVAIEWVLASCGVSGIGFHWTGFFCHLNLILEC